MFLVIIDPTKVDNEINIDTYSSSYSLQGISNGNPPEIIITNSPPSSLLTKNDHICIYLVSFHTQMNSKSNFIILPLKLMKVLIVARHLTLILFMTCIHLIHQPLLTLDAGKHRQSDALKGKCNIL